ncbi:putative heat shock protein HspR [bacterium BMS3Bbin06]|nr:putative heat shock protein HspR [bacterium BMS3Abin08]GBE33687.1 putative heat shock protein HspR [bacterium BMS3Bbin06]HDO36935.1 MerR family transcriptional regulator [Nitrospirota bacterium]
MVKRDKKQPLFMISVVSELLGVHPQTLRLYEREGLIRPKRLNRQRLYSEEDIERLTFILELTRELGVNRAGVDIILRMRERLVALQREVDSMLGCLEGDMRKEFERKIRKIFTE